MPGTADTTPTAATELAPLRQLQVYEQVAGRLEDWIRAGRLNDGDRLPAERELAVRLGVSRSSVREAIGSLALDGIVETRAGAGSFVTAGAAASVRERAPGVPIAADAAPFSLLQARAALEPGVARAAAERARPSDRVEELLAQMDAATDPARADQRLLWSEADRLFHRELAAMTGNPVLEALADHIAGLMDQPLWRRLRDDLIAVPGRTVTHVAEHRLIYQSIVEGQPDEAAVQAASHIQRVQRQMRN